jgi:23S rRNA (uracil1939-C5)-methyltransferase
MPEIVGVAAFHEPQKGVREPLVAVGDSALTYQTKAAAYRVSAGAFFQTNRFLTDELVNIVTTGRSGDLALDLYAGVGLFSTALACDIRHIVSVEMSQTAVADLKYNLHTNGMAIQCATEQYLDELTSRPDDSPAQSRNDESRAQVGNGSVLPHSLHKPDLIVVDPPRSGLGDRVARLIASAGAPRVTYVSCDPATLARDLLPLQAAGYRVEEVHLVDLFPQTYHLETVVQLVR